MALDFIAGSVGGCAGILVGHPFDTVKVRLQTQDFRNPVYRGTFHCFQTILQKESVAGLYRGMSSPLAGVAFINAIVFGVYGNAQRRMSNPDSLSSHFVAGFSAGLAQSFVCSPMELAKIRMQVQQGDVYRSSLHCIVQVTRSGGVRGIYRGLGVTMARDAPGVGVYFMSYEFLIRSFNVTDSLNIMPVMIAGGLAGSLSWLATFPVDVIKSRLQMDGMYGPAKYTGVVDCFRQSLKTEGHSFILRGLASTLIRAFPVNAATFLAVTWVFRIAGVDHPDIEESGYFVASQYEEEEEYSKVKLYRPVSGEDMWGLKLTELWRIWENKALKGLFHWRKLMVHHAEGSLFLDHTENKGITARMVNNEIPQGTIDSSSLDMNVPISDEEEIEHEDDELRKQFQSQCSQNNVQGAVLSTALAVRNGEDTLNGKCR